MIGYKFNQNNTKGKYPVSFDFIDTEIKKDDEIVATDIPDLYDVDVTYPVDDGSALRYDETVQLWKPGSAGGGSCTRTPLIIYVNENQLNPPNNGNGSETSPFIKLKYAFEYLDNCKVIDENTELIIRCLNNVYIDAPLSLNTKYGHRVRIQFGDPSGDDVNSLVVYKDFTFYEGITSKIIYIGTSIGLNLTDTTIVNKDNYIYLFGGRVSTTYYNRMYRFNIDTGLWTLLTTLGSGRAWHTSILYKDRYIIIYGGLYSLSMLADNDVIIYDILTNTSRTITNTSSITQRRYHSANIYNDKMYIFGGSDINGMSIYNDLWEFDLITEQWTLITPTNTTNACYYHSSIIINDELYIFGGNYMGTYNMTFRVFNFATRTWRNIYYGYNTPYVASGKYGLFPFDGGIIAIGTSSYNYHFRPSENTMAPLSVLNNETYGEIKTYNNDNGFLFNYYTTAQFKKVSLFPFYEESTSKNIEITDSHSIKEISGIERIQFDSNAGLDGTQIIDIVNDIVVDVNNFRRTVYGSCVYDTSNMYVYGGYEGEDDNSIKSNIVSRFNYYSNKWEHINTSPIGSARHSASLYNNSMYVFGGYNTQDGLNNGIRIFNVSTYEWSAVNLIFYYTGYVYSDTISNPPYEGLYSIDMSSDDVYVAAGNNIFKRNGDNFNNIGTFVSPGIISSVKFSSDSNYIMAGCNSYPYVLFCKRNGDVFDRLPNPTFIPPVRVDEVDISSDGTYFAAAHVVDNFTPGYLTIYKRSGDTFTKLPNITGGWGNGDGPSSVAFSPNADYVAVGNYYSPYVNFFKRSGDTFTKLPDPATLPTGAITNISFSKDGIYVAFSHGNSPYVTIYKRSGDTFTKIPNINPLPGTPSGISLSNVDSNYLIVSHATSTLVYKRSGDNFVGDATVPVSFSPARDIRDGAFSSDDRYLITCDIYGAGMSLFINRAGEVIPYDSPPPMYNHTSLFAPGNDRFWICGGTLADDTLLNTVWVFDISLNLWAQQSNMPYTFRDHTAVNVTYYGDWMYIFGVDIDGVSRILRNPFSSDSWTEIFPSFINTLELPNFSNISVSALGTDVYIYGGDDFENYYYRLNVTNNVFSRISYINRESGLLNIRKGHVAANERNHIRICGGFEPGEILPSDSHFVFNPRESLFTENGIFLTSDDIITNSNITPLYAFEVSNNSSTSFFNCTRSIYESDYPPKLD